VVDIEALVDAEIEKGSFPGIVLLVEKAERLHCFSFSFIPVGYLPTHTSTGNSRILCISIMNERSGNCWRSFLIDHRERS